MLITAGHFWLHAPHRFNAGGNGLAYLHDKTTFSLGDSRYNNSAAFGKLASIPEGNSGRYAWVPPRKAGGMSSHNEAELSFSPSGAILGGKALEGSVTFTVATNIPDGQLVSTVQAGGAPASFSITTNTPLLTASLNADGSATFTITFATTAIGAEASIVGDSTVTISGTLTPYALGHMEGTTEEQGLTVSGITNSVWSKIIEAGFSAEQIMRLIAAHAAGSATGLEGSNPQFTGLDGVTLRIDGTYTGGTRVIDSLNGD